jgi:glutathione S-transferase
MSDTVLYDYWRSSASYRLRIALNMTAETFSTVPVDILAKEHRSQEHLARNPQGLVPVLEIDGHSFYPVAGGDRISRRDARRRLPAGAIPSGGSG